MAEKRVKLGRKNRQRKLSVKISILVIILVAVLVAASIVIGSITFKDALTRQYNETAYQIAATAGGYFTEDQLKEYAAAVKKLQTEKLSDEEKEAVSSEITGNTRYQDVRTMMEKLRESTNANDIYIFLLDLKELGKYTPEADEKGEWQPLYYMMDCYSQTDESFTFGDRGSIVTKYMDALEKSQKTGKESDTYIITNTQFGYNITAIFPVKYGDQVVANIGVEIPMSHLQSDIRAFVFRVIMVTVVIMILALLISIFLILRLIVNPIHLVAMEAINFVSENTVVSEKLPTIQTHDEIQMLAESLLALEQGVNLYIDNLQQVTAEKERIGAELNVATQIQADMLPRIFPAFPERKEFDIYATMTPAKEVGGDFYDFFLVDDDHLAMVMADVSGKGVPAALFMVIAKTLIKNQAQLGKSPAEVLENVNNQLCEGNKAELFVTVWLAIIEISTGRGMAANAGHEHPGLRHADGSFELIKYRHSPAVATMEGIPFKEHDFEMKPGDSLFVYTDGVTEATNAGNVLFGEERLAEALNRDPGAKPEELLKNVKEGIDAFVVAAPQFDDITMLGFTYYGDNVTE